MRRLSLTVLATVFIALLVGLWAPTAYADQSRNATLRSCAAGQVMTSGTFSMTNVTRLTQQITVNTRKSSRSIDPPDGFAGGTATYDVTFDGVLQSAQATVPSDWAGSFSLTNINCVASKAAITTTVSLCGMTPVVLSAFVTNNNPVMVRYTVKLTGFADKTALLDSNEREEVTFGPLTRGSSYTLTVVGEDGTNSPTPLTVNPCAAPPGPGPKPTTKAPKGTPTLDPIFVEQSASVEPSISPTESAPVDNPVGKANDHSRLLDNRFFWAGVVLVALPIIGLAGLFIYYWIKKTTATP